MERDVEQADQERRRRFGVVAGLAATAAVVAVVVGVLAISRDKNGSARDDQGNVAWSPDGTRIAVKTSGGDGHDGHGTVVISAADGSVLMEHPHNPGWLIWPARQG